MTFQSQTARKGLAPMVRLAAAVVFSLVCVLLMLPGTAEAKGGGGRSGGGRSSGARTASSYRQHYPVQQQHKHKKSDGDMDGGEGGDGDGAEGAEAGEGAESGGAADAGQAAEVEVAVYGMEITGLYKGAAAKGGLGVGDIIMKVNGTSTPTFEALSAALAQSGGRARVVVIREGDEEETVTIYPQYGLIGVSVEPARVE